MKGDFSRFTFNPSKHYVNTLMQQGRVQLDSDWNEQQVIHRYQREKAVGDIIGPHGVPNVDGGFEIQVLADGSDVTLSPGLIYVDGIRIENDATQPVNLSDQPFLKLATGGLAGYDLPAQSGRYLVYLDVWDRHLTAIEDPEIREAALGGVDTTTRVQSVWQARLTSQPLPPTAACEQFSPTWVPPGETTTGRMRAETVSGGSTESACVLPPVAGYRGLENQLYRVEVHRSGTRGDPSTPATIKWSRENGSVVTTVTVSGQVLAAHDLGRDEVLGFAENQWVEIIDERMDLANQRGHLLQIESINPNTREITISASTPVPVVDTARPVILRRWENSVAAGTVDGIPMGTEAITLENGINVTFYSGYYNSGDYWLIPARTAINSETGIIQWPQDGGGQPIAKAPHGIVHRYCPLALVDFVSGTNQFAIVAEADCRPRFPALTQIRAEDVSFDNTQCDANNMLTNVHTVQSALDAMCAQLRDGCTVLITPQSDIEDVFSRLNAQGMISARICFQAGTYNIDQSLQLGASGNPKGHIIVTGFGAGTRIIAQNAETAIRFENCESVTVRDISVEARRVGSSGSENQLRGAMTFVDCKGVSVEDCKIKSWSGPVQGATCITATQSQTTSQWTTWLRVRACILEVGLEQVGILVFNTDRTQIEDNQIASGRLPQSLSLDQLLVNKDYRAIARRALVSRLQYGGDSPEDMTNVETVIYRGQTSAYFLTSPTLIGRWQALIDSLGPSPTTDLALRERLELAANRVLLNNFDTAQFAAFAQWRNSLQSRFRSVAAQGVVVAGSTNGGETRILNNTIEGVLQGIRVGYSRRESVPGRLVRAMSAHIQGNRVQMIITPIVSRHPEGIFAGSFSTELLIEGNVVSGAYSTSRNQINAHVEGIKVFGELGSMLLVRHNNVSSLDSAIRVVPLNGPHTGVHRWLVADNLATGFTTNAEIPDTVDAIGNLPGGISYRDLLNMINSVIPSG